MKVLYCWTFLFTVCQNSIHIQFTYVLGMFLWHIIAFTISYVDGLNHATSSYGWLQVSTSPNYWASRLKIRTYQPMLSNVSSHVCEYIEICIQYSPTTVQLLHAWCFMCDTLHVWRMERAIICIFASLTKHTWLPHVSISCVCRIHTSGLAGMCVNTCNAVK